MNQEKEIFTKEHILQDFRNAAFNWYSLWSACILLAADGVLFALVNKVPSNYHVLTVIMLVFLNAALLLVIGNLFYYDRLLKTNRFRVVRRPVIKSKEHLFDLMDRERTYTLNFGQIGAFSSHQRTLYRWSHKNTTTYRDIFERTCEGEEFYLVIIGKKQIIMIYSTATFLWEEDNEKKQPE